MSETLSPPSSGPNGFRAAWAVPLIPVAVSGFLLSAMTWFRLSGATSTGAESGLQALVVGLYEAFGFEPLFMVCVLALTWSSIWFLTGRMDRPLGRLLRIVALGLCLAILVNLRVDGAVPGGSGSGTLGAFLASRMSATLTPTLSIFLVAAASVASLLLATDFFFYGHFDGLARRSRQRRDQAAGAVEREAVAALEDLRLEVPDVAPRPAVAEVEPGRGGSGQAASAVAIDVGDVDVDEAAADEVGDEVLSGTGTADEDEGWAVAEQDAEDADAEDDVRDEEGADAYAEDGPLLDEEPDDAAFAESSSWDADDVPADEEDESGPTYAEDAALDDEELDAEEPDDAAFAEPSSWDADDVAVDESGDEEDESDPAYAEDATLDGEELDGEELDDEELDDEEIEDDAADDAEYEDGAPEDEEDDPASWTADDTELEIEDESDDPASWTADDTEVEAEEEAALPVDEADVVAAALPADEPVYELDRPDPAQAEPSGDAIDAELVAEAEALVLEYRRASANFLKRRLRVSMDDALALLQALAQRGVVECEAGSAQGRVVSGS